MTFTKHWKSVYYFFSGGGGKATFPPKSLEEQIEKLPKEQHILPRIL